jgi:hypothetical protein
MKVLFWVWLGPVLAACYVGLVYLVAWFEVKAQPRADAFLCDKHGVMNAEYTISFAGVKYCSICFHEKLGMMEKVPSNGDFK